MIPSKVPLSRSEKKTVCTVWLHWPNPAAPQRHTHLTAWFSIPRLLGVRFTFPSLACDSSGVTAGHCLVTKLGGWRTSYDILQQDFWWCRCATCKKGFQTPSNASITRVCNTLSNVSATRVCNTPSTPGQYHQPIVLAPSIPLFITSYQYVRMNCIHSQLRS